MAIVAAGGEEAHQSDLARAITASDNAAAERLWTALGGGATAAQAADAQLRDAGDEHTQIESRPLLGPAYTSFGQTEWSLRDQATFTAGLPCVGAAGDVLALMGRVVPAQRWGLGASEANAEFKGGWGPGTQPGVGGGYLDRQLGLITIAGRWLAVAIAARPADGSHQTGAAELTTIARWLVDHADVHDLPTKPEC